MAEQKIDHRLEIMRKWILDEPTLASEVGLASDASENVGLGKNINEIKKIIKDSSNHVHLNHIHTQGLIPPNEVQACIKTVQKMALICTGYHLGTGKKYEGMTNDQLNETLEKLMVSMQDVYKNAFEGLENLVTTYQKHFTEKGADGFEGVVHVVTSHVQDALKELKEHVDATTKWKNQTSAKIVQDKIKDLSVYLHKFNNHTWEQGDRSDATNVNQKPCDALKAVYGMYVKFLFKSTNIGADDRKALKKHERKLKAVCSKIKNIIKLLQDHSHVASAAVSATATPTKTHVFASPPTVKRDGSGDAAGHAGGRAGRGGGGAFVHGGDVRKNLTPAMETVLNVP